MTQKPSLNLSLHTLQSLYRALSQTPFQRRKVQSYLGRVLFVLSRSAPWLNSPCGVERICFSTSICPVATCYPGDVQRDDGSQHIQTWTIRREYRIVFRAISLLSPTKGTPERMPACQATALVGWGGWEGSGGRFVWGAGAWHALKFRQADFL
eukprot:825000-Amorphochlora_amoeboformis.AAC.1